MAYWTMRFRLGTGGKSMRALCYDHRVAAITYYPVAEVDLRNYSKESLPPQWDELAAAQKFSLACVAFEMEIGDIIYVRDKGSIIGKGEVRSKYFFDNQKRIIDDNNMPWAHQVSVEWNTEFAPVHIDNIGPVQFTVWRLENEEITRIERLIKQSLNEARITEASEGEIVKKKQDLEREIGCLLQRKKCYLTTNVRFFVLIFSKIMAKWKGLHCSASS